MRLKNLIFIILLWPESALTSRDNYRPGDGLNLNLGFRYLAISSFIPQLQLNGRYSFHDTGVNADSINTGGTLLFLSPGVTAALIPQWSIFTFVQLPLYQNVIGVQLVPSYTISVGLSNNI